MHNANIKNSDDLIAGLKVIISKYRCSFSDEEKVLLNDCINELEKSRASSNPLDHARTTVKVVSTALRVFTIYDHIKDLF